MWIIQGVINIIQIIRTVRVTNTIRYSYSLKNQKRILFGIRIRWKFNYSLLPGIINALAGYLLFGETKREIFFGLEKTNKEKYKK